MFPRWTVLTISACLLLVACSPKPSELVATAKQYIAKGDRQSALLQLKSGLADNPGNPEMRFLLGQTLLRGGDAVAATIELKKARELGHPASAVVPELARAMLAQNKHQALVDEFANLRLDSADANAELKSALAAAYANLGRHEAMVQAVDDAVAASPKLPSVLLARARLLAGRGDADGALKLIDEVDANAQLQVDAKLLRADILLRARNDPVGAVAALRQALAADPLSLVAHVAIIGIEMSQGHADLAKQQLQALKLAMPKHPQVLYLQAQIAYIDKDYGRALETLELLLRAYPDVAALRMFAGAVQYQRNALLQAETLLSKAIQLDPKLVLARQYLARTYLRMGQSAKALSALGDLASTAKPSAESVAVAAEAQLLAGDLASAEVLFNQAAKLKPSDVSLRTAAVLTRLAKGQSAEAFQSLQDIAKTDPGITADLALVSLRMRRGEQALAVQAIEQIERKQPKDPQVAELRGRVHLMRRDVAAARASFEQALVLQPSYYAATQRLAALDLADQHLDQARQRFEDAVKANPRNSDARLAGIELTRRGGADQAEIIRLLTAAVLADAAHAPTRLALVVLYKGARDAKKSLAVAQDAAVALPNDMDILGALGEAQIGVGEVQQAVRTFGKIVSILPKSEVAQLRLADATAASGDLAGAEAGVRRGLEVLPESRLLQRRLVALAVQSKDASKSLAWARTLQHSKPGSAAGFMLEGDIQAGQKNWPAAVVAYRQASEKRTADPKSAGKLHAAMLMTDAAAAEGFATQWLKTHPADAGFRVHLGSRALVLGDAALAERLFTQAVSIAPRNWQALNDLAWLMADRGAKGGLRHALQAAALAPGEPAVLDTLAKTQALEESLDRALATQRQAVGLAPAQPVLRLNLARFLIKAGRREDALGELDKLAALGPGFNRQAEVQRMRKDLGA